MPEPFAPSPSSKLRNLTAELRLMDRDLKSNPSLDGATLREFRQALDNIRMTAWTANELLNAQESQKNPRAVISFLTGERMRRLKQMVHDLTGDFERDGHSWPAQAVDDLRDALTLLRDRLRNAF